MSGTMQSGEDLAEPSLTRTPRTTESVPLQTQHQNFEIADQKGQFLRNTVHFNFVSISFRSRR